MNRLTLARGSGFLGAKFTTMPTIAEIIAAKKKALEPKPAAVPVVPGKSAARSIVLRQDAPDPEAPDDQFPPKWLEGRSLSNPKGEAIPMTPVNPDKETSAWYAALQAFETELCAMRHPEDPEAVWLAIRYQDRPEFPPILLHRLPWLLWEHPATVTDEEPY